MGVCSCICYIFRAKFYFQSEDILAGHRFKCLFEGENLVLRLRLELGLGQGSGLWAGECITSMKVLTKTVVQRCVCVCVSHTIRPLCPATQSSDKLLGQC